MIAPPTRSEQRDALKFAQTICGDIRTPQTWQTFADKKDGTTPPTVLHGSLYDVGPRLVRLNCDGAGVFLTVNQTDLRGRKRENIQRVRALFIDCDGTEPTAWHLPPSMVVRSAHGPHAYWVVSDCELRWFPTLQKRLAAFYGSDPVVHNLDRVMRVPGFAHNKGAPFRVWVERVTESVYTSKQVLAGVPRLAPAAKPAPMRLPTGAAHWRTADPVQLFSQAGMYLRPLGGGKHAVVCPWAGQHSTCGGEYDTGTVLFTSGREPAFRCAHSHCQGRYLAHAVAEIGGWASA